jgi:hypothetical protein
MGKHLKKIKIVFASCVLLSTIFPNNVYAYLDPGTGSYVLQLAIAALLGGLYAVKVFWKRITNFFKNIFTKGKKF